MPFTELKQLLEIRSYATPNFIKKGLLVSTAPENILNKYKSLVQAKEKIEVNYETVIN